MNRGPRSLSAGLVLGALVCTGVATAQETTGYVRALDRAISEVSAEIEKNTEIWQEHTTWETAWVVRSQHYEVRTVHGHGLGQRIADGLEVMLGHFQQTLATDHAPSERFKIFVVPDAAMYNQLGNAASDNHAAYHSSIYGSFFAPDDAERPVVAIYVDNETLLQMQITHSALHQFLASAYPGTPPAWVREGLAGYFSVFWDYGWGVDTFESLRDGGNLSSARTLLGDAIDAYPNPATARFIEMGMLFYSLIIYREDTQTTEQQAPFRDYLVALLEGRDGSGLPAHELAQNLNALDADFRSFQFPRQ